MTCQRYHLPYYQNQKLKLSLVLATETGTIDDNHDYRWHKLFPSGIEDLDKHMTMMKQGFAWSRRG